MKKKTRKIGLAFLIGLLLLQLYQPGRNTDHGTITPRHFSRIYNVPDSVNRIFSTSCYDCHSNNTQYPWYSYIQPIRLFQENHIRKGKAELNFSEFGNYPARRRQSKLEGIRKQVKSGKMPLQSYTLLHKNARLTARQKEMVVTWIETLLTNED